MPVEGMRGPGGGYRLRPGFKLPPLLFTEEEATAVVLGLLGASWLEIDLPSVALEGALAKVYRVLPLKGRERLQAISSHMLLLPLGVPKYSRNSLVDNNPFRQDLNVNRDVTLFEMLHHQLERHFVFCTKEEEGGGSEASQNRFAQKKYVSEER